MKLPWTLSRYIGKHFLLAVIIALFGLLAITSLVDVVEMIRRASGRDGVPFHIIISLTLLKLPNFAIKLIPYAVLIGSMMALTRLTKTQELVIARAAGISAWQFLAPAMILVFVIGTFMTSLFNPFAAALMMRHEQVEGKYISGRASLLAVSSSGLWLRQIENSGEAGGNISEHIIHSAKLVQSDTSFAKVIIFAFDKDKKFVERLDAERAVLQDKILYLTDVTRSIPGKPAETIKDYALPTTLTLEHIQDSFASPETISFWQLPGFINTLESAGFSALKHKLYWHTLLANPFLMIGTMLIAAVFSLRLPRRGKIGILIVSGIITGFLMHFFTDIIFAFGAAGTIPTILAAWTPALVTNMIGAALLLHLEDG
ncbi:MAG: LPS export ABC transporter permease LptG [Rickettsiales bacterium]